MNTTQHYALIGHPISRSPSPAMHNAAFKHLHINADYSLRDTDTDALHTVEEALNNAHWSGFNVTTPIKEHVASLVTLQGNAARAQATNTLFKRNGQWMGDLTDVEGITTPLKARTLASAGRMIILGSGGATRAAALAGEALGLPVTIAARRPDAAHDIFTTLQLTTPTHVVDLHDMPSMASTMADAAVIVQATPVGRNNDRHPLPWHVVPQTAIAFEMLYASRMTLFLHDAHSHGLDYIEGWEMLLAQGARAFEIWTQQTAPIDVMRNAILGFMR